MLVSLLVLFLFFAAVACAALTGVFFRPDAWYREIDKPSFTPPDWVFPPAWTVLYAMIAIAGFVLWYKVGFAAAPWAFAFYFLQIGLNAAWSPLFFGAKRPDLAMLDIAALWLAIVATIIAFSQFSLTAAFLLVPYLLWVTFAAALTVSIWRLNRGEPRRRVG
ncbi:TspO/MBR family protein [Amorphus coralli]|uniref:TspO/MBR family protein n=1 Tax=Amorphus coralli TaxID=340680 RepID=UPI00036C35C4|nr:TspO/MBR family protein [Amorphus coralli]